MDDGDLREAVKAGLFVLQRRGLGGVERRGRIVIYDPNVCADERARCVARIISSWKAQ